MFKYNITLQEIKDKGYSVSGQWSGNLHEFLDMKTFSLDTRINGCIEFLDNKTRRLFACWAAEESLKRIANPDPRSVEVIKIARLFALNKCTEKELSAAESAAWSAARSAASAAESAAWSAAESAAWSAAESAAWSAARSAAESAAESAAWSAARSAEKEKQILKLKDMITEKLNEKVSEYDYLDRIQMNMRDDL